MDLWPLPLLAGFVSEVPTGAPLTHFPLEAGEVAVADRGYAQCPGRQAAVAQGADLMVRLHPCSGVLRDAAGVPLALGGTWQRQQTATRRTLTVTLGATGGQQEGRGGVQA
jgi:hypothetical protein